MSGRHPVCWALQGARGSIPDTVDSAFTRPQAHYSSSVNDFFFFFGQAQNIKIELLAGLPSQDSTLVSSPRCTKH